MDFYIPGYRPLTKFSIADRASRFNREIRKNLYFSVA
jgi:hypothetical protein